jgi:tetratricopeptide (TPR) repeat protein
MIEAYLFNAITVPESWQMVIGPIRDVEALINQLKRDWTFMLTLTLIVIGAGGISSLLQLTKQESAKWVVAICGAVSAGVTAFVGVVYPLSAKEIDDRVVRAAREMRKASVYMHMTELPPVANGRAEHLQKLQQHLDNTELILGGSRLPAEEVALAPSFVSEAFAAGNAFSEFPRNTEYLYFVGTSIGESLDGARTDAIRLAQQEVQRTILDQLPPSGDSSSIAELLGKTGSVADTKFNCTQEGDANSCEYSVLYAIKRQTADFYLSSSGVNRAQALEAMQKQESYYQQRWHAYAGALDLAREKLSEEQYAVLIAGRVARRAKDYAESVRLLSTVVQKGNASWYLGWLNLGLAYWTLGKQLEADAAFAEAAVLEPQLPVRDASVYNTYGQFLVERKDYDKATAMLTKALEINPEITGARYSIKVAAKKPAEVPSAEMKGTVVP